MLLVLGSVLGGLGLFFVGLKLLTENLKLLSGRRLREKVATWTRNPFLGVIWGGLFITITQSAAAATFILIGMLRAGMLTVQQILPILIGVNLIGGVIVLVLVFDVKLAVFLLLGVTGLIYSRDPSGALRPAAGAAFGVGMLFLGLNTTQAGIAPMAEMAWFKEALASSQGSYVLGFLLGAVFSFVVQSALAVVILSLAFLQADLFSLEQCVMIAYGAKVGSSVLTYFLSNSLRGESRQVAMFQVAFNLVGAVVLVPAFFVEIYTDIPLMMALAATFSGNESIQLGIVNLLFNAVPALLAFPCISLCTKVLSGYFPRSSEEELSRPQYLLEHTGDDPHNAMELIELEQTRLLGILSLSFEAMRAERDGRKMDNLKEAFGGLAEVIQEAMHDLSSHHQLSSALYDRLNAVLNIQRSLATANLEIQALAAQLAALRSSERGQRFARVAVDGIDAILLTLIDVAKEHNALDAQLLEQMTSEDGMARVRKAYLAEDESMDATSRMQLLAAANHCERLIWLFGDTGQAYHALAVSD
jgi:phosphate:Na+ symporter